MKHLSDAKVLDTLSQTLSESINSLMTSLTEIDANISGFSTSNAESMFIKAKIAHANVLRAMQMAIINQSAAFDLPSDRNCGFGKVYYSDSVQKRFGTDRDFKAIEKPHQDAHVYAKNVMECIRQRNFNDIHAHFNDFNTAVEHFGDSINRMIEKVRLK